MHTIRLRGPWQLEPVARFVPQKDGTYFPVKENLPPADRVTMPADWSSSFGTDFLGRVRYHRVFQKPTGLDNGEHVFLVVEPPRSSACITLFEKLVGFVDPGEGIKRFDVTDQLQDHNRLSIFVDHPDLDCMRSTVGDPTLLPPGGLIGEVRLEIEES
jgi:hypothetical protein